MRDYQRQLQTLRDQIAQREEDLAVLVRLEQQEEACRRQVEECHARWEQEQKDVDRLERVSLAALLSALRGSKDEDLDREQAEAYAARMRLQEAERAAGRNPGRDSGPGAAGSRRQRIAGGHMNRYCGKKRLPSVPRILLWPGSCRQRRSGFWS